MNITNEWLQKNRACKEGAVWFNAQAEIDAKTVLMSLLEQDHFDWANWAVVRLMARKQRVKYAIYAAKKALKIYESTCPKNKAPREAIKAAKACFKNPSEKNKTTAYDAAYAAYAAAYTADTTCAACATHAAAYATYTAAYAADTTCLITPPVCDEVDNIPLHEVDSIVGFAGYTFRLSDGTETEWLEDCPCLIEDKPAELVKARFYVGGGK
jgi:hypothetical protein